MKTSGMDATASVYAKGTLYLQSAEYLRSGIGNSEATLSFVSFSTSSDTLHFYKESNLYSLYIPTQSSGAISDSGNTFFSGNLTLTAITNTLKQKIIFSIE